MRRTAASSSSAPATEKRMPATVGFNAANGANSRATIGMFTKHWPRVHSYNLDGSVSATRPA